MRMWFRCTSIAVTAAFTALPGCGNKYAAVAGNLAVDAGPCGVIYEGEIKALLDSNCTQCHGGANGRAGVSLDSYDNAVLHADRANARIQAGTMPPGGGLSNSDAALFQAWVDGGKLQVCAATDGGGSDGGETADIGAPDVGPLPDVGSGTITYCHEIKPILDANCTGCHSSTLTGVARNSAPVGIDYDTYIGAAGHAARAEVRILAGTMPLTGPLSASDQALFKGWVEQGTPECSANPYDGGTQADAGPPALTCTSGRTGSLEG